jgi:hypothetical protein
MKLETIKTQKEQDNRTYRITCIFCGEIGRHLEVNDINALYKAHAAWHYSQLSNLGNTETAMCASAAV